MVVVSRARPEHVGQVWPLARDFATSSSPERTVFEQTCAALLDRPDTLVAVATVDGVDDDEPSRVVGYLLASTHLTFLANGPVCWVEEVMVDAGRRRSGVGAALMAYAEDWAAGQGCAYVSLASRRSGDFYRALGFDDSAVFFKRSLER
ncbi:ribosomal protein S18 acetylase RimI-like enzyme [Isoptericola jiangsuensis]|uniref:Ribosomal protein S18 acetylase RimI-like enzyme n=1 Tax=Isoptericola jiangsuensis TaxID=548579 RepID=A0A2A9ETL5_9MICO|nr:GNAT family N-acetyltransferase [Isoptericola jiangsuensis]PFG41509.1 ribosomal protein S18 acetylase RimI-like enzyme [Isoptericola jiangsuensis]